MKNLPYYFAITLFSALLVACPDLKNKHFKEGEAKLMTDEKGVRYMITHLNCDQYSVKPLDPEPAPTPSNPPEVSPQPSTPQPSQIDPKWR